MGNTAGHHDILSCIVTNILYHVSFCSLTLTLLLSENTCSACLTWCYYVIANAIVRWHDYCWLHRSAFLLQILSCCDSFPRRWFASARVSGIPQMPSRVFRCDLWVWSSYQRVLTCRNIMHYPVWPLQVPVGSNTHLARRSSACLTRQHDYPLVQTKLVFCTPLP